MKYRKPLIVAGHGIKLAKAQGELMKVLELAIPAVTTFNGFDLVPSNHPCFVGRIGTVGTQGGYYAAKNCDLIFELGTRNNIRQISYKPLSFAPQAKKFIVDIDHNELLKNIENSILVVADVKEYLKTMLKWPFFIDENWLRDCKTYQVRHDNTFLARPYRFIYELTSLLSEGAVVVCGNGTACVCMFQAGVVKKGQRILWNSGTASMGYDLPAAIGACFANNKKEVVCVTGEGSLQMNIQELQTIKHYGLPIKIFVLNNGGYHSIKMTQDNYFKGDRIGCDKSSGVSFPDLQSISAAYGIEYFNMNIHEIQRALNYPSACIAEVFIRNDYKIEPKWTGGYDG